MSKKFTLGKTERLKTRKQIEQLFKEGKVITVIPFRIYYSVHEVNNHQSKINNIQFGAGVSGKIFKKAVDRNRIKRLIKEAYRLQKIFLTQMLKEKKRQLNVFFIYTGKELPDFNLVKEKVGVALKKLAAIIDENISSNT